MQEAIKHLQKAIKLNPDFADAHYELATLLDVENEYSLAKKHYLKSIDLKKGFEKAHFKLATMLKRKKSYKESKKHYLTLSSSDRNQS